MSVSVVFRLRQRRWAKSSNNPNFKYRDSSKDQLLGEILLNDKINMN